MRGPRFPGGGIIDPNLALAIADRVLAKRWPGLAREQFLEGQRNGGIECSGVAADVGGILRTFLPLAARKVDLGVRCANCGAANPGIAGGQLDADEAVCSDYCYREIQEAGCPFERGTSYRPGPGVGR